MNKTIIKVPSHVDKISRWEEFEELLPKGSIILNKKNPGCGMTYYYLHNDSPIVLCCPRNFLLINKVEQLKLETEQGKLFTMSGKRMKYFFFHPSDKTNSTQRMKENEAQIKTLIYFLLCSVEHSFVPKVLITYDSFPAIYNIIQDSRINFKVIMDESHVLFQDYSMKPDIVERALSVLTQHSSVIYLSATPVMVNYLEQMEYFSDLPYVELEWPENRVREVKIFYNMMSSTVDSALKIIQRFKDTRAFDQVTFNGTTIYSTEAVLFINDVSSIVRIIKNAGLSPSEVNILVADNQSNRKKIRELGQEFCIGQIPTEGKRHKTYTFCSKVVFFGCDFYSTSASTFVFADGNSNCMATDIALDLLQIVGRQRLKENLFRSRCYVFVKKIIGDTMNGTEYDKIISRKQKLSESIVESWKSLSQEAIEAIKVNSKKCPYGVIFHNPITGLWTPKLCINKILAEIRAWDLSINAYRTHSSMQSMMLGKGFDVIKTRWLSDDILKFMNSFNSIDDTAKRMKMFCEFFDAKPYYREHYAQLPYDFDVYIKYYLALGTDRIAKHSFILSRIKEEYEYVQLKNFFEHEFIRIFGSEGSYPLKDIKEKIQEIYDDAGINKKAKATDLSLFYDLSPYRTTINGERKYCYKYIWKNLAST